MPRPRGDAAEVKAKGACIPDEKEFTHKSGQFDECTGSGIFCAFDISDRTLSCDRPSN
ncbi:hypothetical protein [Leptolyngbya subtilissima]|uniref:hypothetical protein n=1 Tax=Leptolyngbya subtilissima TaxID=1346803 RepID=UPI001685694A